MWEFASRGGVGWNGDPHSPDLDCFTLSGDGDFRSEECIDLLKQADIIVTNPPFSLFRDFFNQLIEYDKKFVVMGDHISVTLKDVFPHVKEDRLWWGPSISSGDRWFEVPKHYPLTAATTKIVKEGKKERRYLKKKGIRWYTNLDHEKRHKDMILTKKYSASKYPKYEDVDAIEVWPTKNIPKDYPGLMGVPIGFLDKYNPSQFEIVDMKSPKLRMPDGEIKTKFKRFIVRNRRPEGSA